MTSGDIFFFYEIVIKLLPKSNFMLLNVICNPRNLFYLVKIQNSVNVRINYDFLKHFYHIGIYCQFELEKSADASNFFPFDLN